MACAPHVRVPAGLSAGHSHQQNAGSPRAGSVHAVTFLQSLVETTGFQRAASSFPCVQWPSHRLRTQTVWSETTACAGALPTGRLGTNVTVYGAGDSFRCTREPQCWQVPPRCSVGSLSLCCSAIVLSSWCCALTRSECTMTTLRLLALRTGQRAARLPSTYCSYVCFHGTAGVKIVRSSFPSTVSGCSWSRIEGFSEHIA